MNNFRTLLNLFEDEIDPTKVQVDSSEIDPSKVKIDVTPTNPTPRKWAAGTLGLGSRGPEVKALQDKLIAAGLLNPTTEPGGKPANDGIFGTNTQHAVQSLQDRLGVNKDGAYGPITQKALTAKPDALAPEKAPVVTQDKTKQGGEATPPAESPEEVYKRLDAEKAKASAQAQVVAMTKEKSQYEPMGIMIAPGTNKYSNLIPMGIYYAKTNSTPVEYSPVTVKELNSYPDFKKYVDLFTTAGYKIVDNGDYKPATLVKDSGQGGEASNTGTGLKMPANASNPISANIGTSSNFSSTLASTQPGFYTAPNYSFTNESVGFQADELNRIVSLVHYR